MIPIGMLASIPPNQNLLGIDVANPTAKHCSDLPTFGVSYPYVGIFKSYFYGIAKVIGMFLDTTRRFWGFTVSQKHPIDHLKGRSNPWPKTLVQQ
jgi:hypothetical protein